MTEEKFVEESIEDMNISEIDETIVLSVQSETIKTEIKEAEVFNVVVSEDVGPHALKVVTDHAFGLPRQHSIGAIEGLREELDDIERLTTVYSDSANQANYYMWKDENPNHENRSGYFVSVHQDDNKVYLCKAGDDEFGVTVGSAGFVGNQNEEIPRGSNYVLVVHSGLVGVRCRTDVVQGDYVASDDYGMAQKTNGTYGYLVTAISNIDGVRHAIISLTIPTTQMQKFAETTKNVADRMDSAEANIATAISVANAAYNKAQISQNWVQDNVENIAGQVGDIGSRVDDVVVDITKLGNDTVSAKEEALKAQNVASTTLKETQNLNNSMHSNLASLVKHLDPDSTWTNPETGENWDTYFVNYIKNGNIPTSSTIKTLDGRLTQNEAETSHNATQIQQIVTSTDMYSIGEWSQAYGLNLAEAWNILKVGMVYIPTTALHTEKYGYKTIESWGEDEAEIKKRDTNLVYRTKDDGLYWRYLPVAPDGTLTYEWTSMPLKDINDVDYIIDEEEEFTRGYFYTWNGYYWVESDNTPESPVVIFSGAYVDNANGQYLYWYMDAPEDLIVTNNDTDVTYRARSLYKWQSGEWVEVNVLSGNITNRATSSLIQTATEIAANVTNARGWMAHMGVKIDKDGSFVDQVASVVTPLLVNSEKVTLEDECIFDEIPTDSIVGVEGQYYAVGTDQPYDVYIYQDGAWQKKPLLYYDGVYIMKINTSSILLSANEDDAIVSINGPTIFTADENGGVTGINGSCITTGTIASNDGTVKIDLGTGTAGISGKVTATSGYIGDKDDGFTIDRVAGYLIEINDGVNSEILYYLLEDGIYYYFQPPMTLNEPCSVVLSFQDMYAEIKSDTMLLRPKLYTSEVVPYLPDLKTYELELMDNLVYYVTTFGGQNYHAFKIHIEGEGDKSFRILNISNNTVMKEAIYIMSDPDHIYVHYITVNNGRDWFMVLSVEPCADIGNSVITHEPMPAYYCDVGATDFENAQNAQLKLGDDGYSYVSIPSCVPDSSNSFLGYLKGLVFIDSDIGEFFKSFIVGCDSLYSGSGQLSSAKVLSDKQENPCSTYAFSSSDKTMSTNYAIYNNQTSLCGDMFGGSGIYISKNGIGLGNGRFHIDNKGNVMIVSKFNEDGTPYDYSVYNSKGQMRFINGLRVSTYNMSVVCDGYGGSTTGTVQRYNVENGAGGKVDTFDSYTTFYCVGEYWYQLANKYNDPTTTDEQRRQMLNILIIDNTTVSSPYEVTGVTTTWSFNQIKAVDIGTQYGYLFDSGSNILTSDFKGAVIEYYSDTDYKVYYAERSDYPPSWHLASASPKLSCIINSTMDV